jgi:NADH-quinone oxidoreductase subunit J
VAEVIFFIAALGAIAGAVGVVKLENPFYSVLSLVVHLVMLAALFLLLRAEFVAAAQVVVYAGAVMVLYVFVAAYVGSEEPDAPNPLGPNLGWLALLFGIVLVVELSIAVFGTGLMAIDSQGAPYEEGYGTPGQIGELLLTKFLLPFELASMLLLIAAVGAVVLARRRRGAGDDDPSGLPTISVMDLARPEGTGTMAEAVSGIPRTEDGSPTGTHPKGTLPSGSRGGGGEREGGW